MTVFFPHSLYFGGHEALTHRHEIDHLNTSPHFPKCKKKEKTVRHLACWCPPQRYKDLSVVVPYHPPEVLYGARQRILGNDELTALSVTLQEQNQL